MTAAFQQLEQQIAGSDEIESTQPMYLARHFLESEHAARPLRRFCGEWMQYTGEGYEVYPDECLKAALYKHLDGLFFADEKGEMRPLRLNRQTVSNVLDALIACDTLVAGDIPQWTDGRPGATEFLALQNGLLHLKTRKRHLHDPAYFNTTVLPYAFDPAAACPRWLAFLNSLWPKDPESVELLQEWFGYIGTADTRYQKMLLIVGPKRSGKGTIARVAEAMIGAANCCSPTMGAMAQNFGMASLIGKRLAVFGDARISGRSDTAIIVDRLLSLSGGDLQTISRKYRDEWIGTPETRITILSNEIPKLADASGAMASRFLLLELKRSFFGKEDHGLQEALLEELPGILNWALDGLDRLTTRGRFAELSSSIDGLEAMTALGSPITSFVRERCEVKPGMATACKTLYAAWCEWCEEQGISRVSAMEVFGRDLKAAYPECERKQFRSGGGTREGNYINIRII